MVKVSWKLRAKYKAKQLAEGSKRGAKKAAGFVKSLPGKYKAWKEERYARAKAKAERETGRRMTDAQFEAYKRKMKRKKQREYEAWEKRMLRSHGRTKKKAKGEVPLWTQ